MAATGKALQVHYISEDAVRNVAVSFDNVLESGEALTGTPTVTISPTGPTIDNKAVSSESLTINGETVTTGRAVQFRISGVTAGTKYTITISCETDSTPAQTVDGECILWGK